MTAPIITPGKLARAMLHSRNVSCESAAVDTNMSNPLLEATSFCGKLYAALVRGPGAAAPHPAFS